jgi:hypothetical protein
LSVADARAFPTAIAPERLELFAVDALRKKLQAKWKQQNGLQDKFRIQFVAATALKGAQ